jgi:uncharacterized membrane protein YdbT with pleckstrin-like domain
MSYIDDTLTNDEVVLYRTKPHWIIFTPALGWLFLSILILFLAPRYPLANMYIYDSYTLTDILGCMALIVALFSALFSFVTYQSSEYGITNKRILMKVGFISRQSLEILLQRIESIQVFQTVLGRVFDYGTILVNGTGGSKDPFPNIPEPLVFRRFAQQQLEEFHRG